MANKNDIFVTAPFRLAFPEVFKPKAFEGSTNAPKYSINMLFPKDGSSLVPSLPNTNGPMGIRRLLYEAALAKWGADRAKWPANLRTVDFKTYVSPNGKDGWPIRDGDTVEWDGFAGMYFIRASGKRQPGLRTALRQPLTSEDQIFGGLICRAHINAFAYDDAMNKGVSVGLESLQILVDDGTIYGGWTDPDDAFDVFGADTSQMAEADPAW